MKTLLSLLLLCAMLLSVPGCAPVSARELTAPDVTVAPAGSPQVDAALAGFGLSLLREVRSQTGDSALISPLSAALALTMAANGSEGDTLRQFQDLLGDGAELDTINAACAQLMADYQALGGSTRCSIANSVWVDPDGGIYDDFVGRCRGIFDAQVFQTDLSDPGVVSALNGWVSEHTNKMIPRIVDKPFRDAAALLVNALYLKNAWAQPFSRNSTHARDFHHPERTEQMDFLHKGQTSFPYLQGEGAQGVILPYDDGRLGFFALMPDLYPDAPEFDSWLEGLDGGKLEALLSGAREERFLTLALPKFQAEWKGNLAESLPALGLDLAFQPGLADFSRLGDCPDGYYISDVIHATKIEVNEKGTEAAAATVVGMAPTSAPPEDGVTLILDRPFLYGIVDLETDVPLFLGTFE